MRKYSLSALIISLSSMCLVGCASVVTGTSQSVSVKTGDVKNATCTLENNKGKWYVSSTPGTVSINRSFHDLSVDCEKPGLKQVHKTVASSTKPVVFGNILLGGPIGAAVDVSDGAAYNYPSEIDVPMKARA